MREIRSIVSDHPAVDYVPSSLALGIYLGLHDAGIHTVKFAGWPFIYTFHQTLVEAVGVLFGIVFAACAILRALGPGPRLDHLRRKLSNEATNNLMSVVRALGIATLVAIGAMALDTPAGHATLARAATVWAMTLALVRVVRLIWYFGLVLDLNDRDVESSSSVAGDSGRRLTSPRRTEAS